VVARDAVEAIRSAHVWFEHNSGWAPPDEETLAEWVADGVSRCPDECLVAPGGWCEHGLASWWLILRALDEPPLDPAREALLVPHVTRLDPNRSDYDIILAAHRTAMDVGEAGYLDPSTGLFVLTAQYLADRGYCCDEGCRHCPYTAR
jgi:hypothetical protein